MLLIGHRGVAALEPENTLRSIDRALALGLPMIEIDVRFVRHHLYILHDLRLDRTTNLSGALNKKPYAAIRSADAGHGEQIPLLREVIERIERRAVLNIELKGGRGARPVVALLEEFIERGWQAEDFLISSFALGQLAIAKRANASIPRGLLVGARPVQIIRNGRQLGVASVHLSRKKAVPSTVTACQTEGWKVYVYTVNDPKEAARLASIGVDGIFTDNPVVMQEAGW